MIKKPVRIFLLALVAWTSLFQYPSCDAQSEENASNCSDELTPVWSGSDWVPIDDEQAELFPSRAIDTPYESCREVEPEIVINTISLLNFHEKRKTDPELAHNVVYVALNGASQGSVFAISDMSCLGRLANFAYDFLAPRKWAREGPKFLYSSGGLPIRTARDIVDRARRELHVLNARQSWVWPAHRVGLSFNVSGVEMITVSEVPRVFSLSRVLTDAECEAIINEYDKTLIPSPEKHYSDEFRDHRTSETGWMRDHPLRYKIQRVLRLPFMSHVETLQFLKYKPGKWYRPHHDYFHDYQPRYYHLLRRWLKERISSIVELPSDWEFEEDSVEEDVAQSLRQAQKALARVLPKRPRGIITFGANKSKLAVLHHVMVLDDARPPLGFVEQVTRAVSGQALHDLETIEELAGQDYERVCQTASKVFASRIASEIGLDLKYAHVLNYGTELDALGVLETEPLMSAIQPNRHATVLPYLSDVEEGGETALPNAMNAERFLGSSFVYPNHPGVPECSRGLVLRPIKGSASLFYHRKPSGALDDRSFHAGCPPIKGIKYAINGFTWSAPSGYGTQFFGI